MFMVLGLMQFEKQFHMLEAVVHMADKFSFQVIDPLIRIEQGRNAAHDS
jgi:hypothetical protein